MAALSGTADPRDLRGLLSGDLLCGPDVHALQVPAAPADAPHAVCVPRVLDVPEAVPPRLLLAPLLVFREHAARAPEVQALQHMVLVAGDCGTLAQHLARHEQGSPALGGHMRRSTLRPWARAKGQRGVEVREREMAAKHAGYGGAAVGLE
eukprot:CAMPEP_0179067048 /NCGR_PEP_ID=MMETSP0796-20121207/29290_1 /TAXON_ID=73915 /ORGANISM="Pyrodinium bahamense, Strain pbaha01" /LENGTH=150 /DNA_ID=CAMNT_0020764069 /DNA_START=47 /DNA_END=495 /DNA_ORIENTATION=-